tara:strand:- start:723 stop:884 length:162 start_codon:yes stop_codon:yes gene_type:complete
VIDKTYEEVLDMIEAYGFERILEDGEMNKSDVLLILDELGFIELEMYDDDYSR